jgi:hypothetical protein
MKGQWFQSLINAENDKEAIRVVYKKIFGGYTYNWVI